MANVLDVAAYVLELKQPISSWKLQKLVYYSQAWSLVWDEAPIFEDSIQAWANGPVTPRLFDTHRGQFLINHIQAGDAKKLNKDERETVEAVIEYYGDLSPQYLSDLTHMEDPWLIAREGVRAGQRSNNIITPDSMAEYYESIDPEDV